MKIKCMPVLHARTYNVDFRSRLLVRPEIFNDEEARLVYQMAADSTQQRELAPADGRHLIYGNGRVAVVGKMVSFRDLYQSCQREEKYVHLDHENGRLAYGFVGIAVPVGTVAKAFELPDSILLDLYEYAVQDRWNESPGEPGCFESKLSVPMELDVPEYEISGGHFMEEQLRSRTQKLILEDAPALRNKLLQYVLERALKGERISLCTSLSTEKAVRESMFEIVTCKNSAAVISALMRRSAQATENPEKMESSMADNGTMLWGSDNGRGRRNGGQADRRPKSLVDSAKQRKRVKSLDDLLAQEEVPDMGERFRSQAFVSKEKEKVNTQSHNNPNKSGFSKNWGDTDTGLILGTILGVTFIAAEAAAGAAPAVIAVTGICTVIIVGAEAKRIINKLRQIPR